MAEGAQKLDNIDALPVTERKRTDVFCTIFNTVFVVLLFIIFLFTFNVENLRKITYPNDAEGRLCGYDSPKYPYLYFTSLTDTSKRLCVSKCPAATDTFLLCDPTKTLSCKKNDNPAHEVVIYQSYLDESRIGLICMPKDENVRNELLNKSGTMSKYQFLGFYDAMWRSIWISIIFAVFFFLFTYFQPYIAIPWVFYVGGFISILFGILILVLADGYWFVKLLLCVFFVGLGGLTFWSLYDANRRESIYICARLMHAAAIVEYDKQYTKLPEFLLDGLSKLLKPALLVLGFMVLFGGFIVLIGFEILSAWSCAKLVFSPSYPFYEVESFGSSLLMFLIFVEAVWGLSFLKESFNFIVSGYSAHKYFSTGNGGRNDPLSKRAPKYWRMVEYIFRYHWGSVVGGSLLLGFFYFVDLIFDFIFPEQPKIYKEVDGVKREAIGFERDFEEKDGYVENTAGFFNLIREQSAAYTFLTNMPYCNSSRYCEFLSSESKFYNYNQSTNRLYRINIHIIPIFFTLLIAMLCMESTGNSSPYGIFCITLITFFTITYPLAYLGDAAEGLLISTFVELAFNDEAEPERAPEVIKIAIREDLDDTYKEDEEGIVRPWYKMLISPVQTE